MDISDFPERLTKNHNFTSNERLMILAEYEKCLEIGQKAAFCRQIGVTQNAIARWRRHKRDGLLVASDSKENSWVMKKRDIADYRRLQRENEDLKKRLEQSESAVEVLGKASELLAALTKSSQTKTTNPISGEVEESDIPPAFQAPKKPDESGTRR